ncbi:MAG: efflux RND transporter periplasmic adaptor subunit [Candidatus Gastranaerophilales bacterium]|nr:efflux RND transporter periplasmic adaptor subunit [Candidatus Gastranaerophilales bacterium]
MKKILIIASLVIVLCVGFRFATTKYFEIMRNQQLKAAMVPVVELDEVKEQEIYKSIEIPGRVESMDKVDLVARIDGYLQKKHFIEGDFVKKGQILFTIEQTQYINNLNEAKAQLQNAKAALYKAERDYGRGAELVKKDYISKSTYDGLYADKLSAQAAVKSAQAQLSEAQRKLSYTTIKAPTDGRIGSLNIHEGNYVTISNGAIATITKTNPIYVKYSVDSKMFDEIRKQNFIPQKGSDPIKVDVILPSGKTYPISGVQDFWDNQISNSTGTIDFRATFKNDENLLIPGDFVKVKVYSNNKNTVLLVPQDLVLQDSTGRYVYVVDNNNTVQTKHFKDGGQYENYWIVNSGLEKGEKFISTGLTKLMPKMPVKIAENSSENQKENNEGK